jgi:hypothetical protein
MEAHNTLDEIVTFVEAARSLPMSSSAVINRSELLDMLERLRAALPDDLKQAEDVLKRRDQMFNDAAANAERLLIAAAEEKERLISDEEVVRAARIEAGEMVRAAREQSDQMSRQVDGYVDAKLAHLEVSVSNILDAIRRGRLQLSEAAGLYADLAADERSQAQLGELGSTDGDTSAADVEVVRE